MDCFATVEGDNLFLDPPVRLLAQWDKRWGQEVIGGASGTQKWAPNGCSATSAAMILRWFAEDCAVGRLAFPTKPGGSIASDQYPLRMAEAFWPLASPPGKVELTANDANGKGGGHVHVQKIFAVAAHYLKTGEITRKEEGGNVVMPPEPRADVTSSTPSEGWMARIRKLLESGPVIVGIGAPAKAGHYVVAHGIIDGGLLIVDPGNVLSSAHRGGDEKSGTENWKLKDGFLDGTSDPDRVRKAPDSQWPEGQVPYQDGDGRGYNLITGMFLNDLLDDLRSVVSLSHPDGVAFE